MINNVVLIGNLTKDIEIKNTGSGLSVCNFTLAVNRLFKSSSGERETDYIECVAWRKTADILNEYTRKGSKIAVTGKIQTRNYTNNDGQKIYVTEVVVEQVELLSTKSEASSSHSTGGGNYTPKTKNGSQGNFGAIKKQPKFDTAPFDNDDSIDISIDDLPFD